MKILRSANTTPLEEMEKGKVRLTVSGNDSENIWVAKDPENNKMYLLNHALAFYPFPSWGTEWELASTLDVAKARGESPDETVLTFHSEAYEYLKDKLKNDGQTLDPDKYFTEESKEETSVE